MGGKVNDEASFIADDDEDDARLEVEGMLLFRLSVTG